MGNFDLSSIGPMVTTILPIVVSYVAAHLVQWKKYSSKLTQFRNLVDDIDNANQNPAISQDQFNKIISDGKALISK